MIDKLRVKQRFAAAVSNYDQQALAQQMIHQDLITLLAKMGRKHFQLVLEIGCGTGGLTQHLMQHLQVEQWELNDLCDMQEYLGEHLPQAFNFYCADAETFPFMQKYELIVSASVVQWFEDKQQFIVNCKKHLKEQGFLLLSTFTQENLKQIKQLTGIGLTYPSIEEWQTWLQPEFDILALTQKEIVLCFEHPLAALKHLKQTGVTATQQRGWTKGRLAQFCREYQQKYANAQQQVELTYSPLYMLARLK